MAKRRRRRQRLPQEPVETTIESLSQDGRGVTHIDGKATFIDGALPGETVQFKYTDQQRKHDEGRTLEVLQASEQRVEPKCAHADVCGGLHPSASPARGANRIQTAVDVGWLNASW